MTSGRHAFAAGSVIVMTTLVLAVGLAVLPAQALTQLPTNTWGVRGKVYATLQSGHRIYVGGKFGAIESDVSTTTYPASSLAGFSALTGIPTPNSIWPRPKITYQGIPGTVKALALSPDGTVLYFGGQFDTVNGVAVDNMAAVSTTTGQLVPTFTPPTMNEPNTILVSPITGEIYLGGSFQYVNQKPRQNLAALLPDGTLDPLWTPSADDNVRVLKFAADGATIFAGGIFTTVNGQPRQSVARLNLDGSLNDWAIPPGVIVAPQAAWDMAFTTTQLYVGFGNATNYFAAFRLDDGNVGDLLWLHHLTGNIETVALFQGRLFLGGHFGTAHKGNACGAYVVHGLAVADPSTGALDCSWLPHLYPDRRNFIGAWTMLIDPVNGNLWVGGFFIQVCNGAGTSCVKQHSLARFTL